MKAAKQANQTTEGARGGPFIQRQCNHCAKEESTPFISPSRVGRVQTKLAVGAPNDIYEQEAEAFADLAVRTQNLSPNTREVTPLHKTLPSSPNNLSGQQSGTQEIPLGKAGQTDQTCGRCSSQPTGRQTTGSTGQLASSQIYSHLQSRYGNGEPLAHETQAYMEQVFNADFGAVTIHRDSEAAQMASELGAQAFTFGSDIYFNEGKYDPSSVTGKKLLAHELTHVLQQTGLSQSTESTNRLTRTSGLGIQLSGNPGDGEIPVQPNTHSPNEAYTDLKKAIDETRSPEVGRFYYCSESWCSGYWIDIVDRLPVSDPYIGPFIDLRLVDPGIYQLVVGDENPSRIERLYQRQWTQVDFAWRNSTYEVLPQGYLPAQYMYIPRENQTEESSESTPQPVRARSRVPEWAWQQWNAARTVLVQRVLQAVSEGDHTQLTHLPVSLTIIPGPSVIVRVRGGLDLRGVLQQNPAEDGLALLERAINLVDRISIPQGREEIQGVEPTAPDWVRMSFAWVQNRLEEDRQRLQEIAEASVHYLTGNTVQDADFTDPERERQIAERRRLLEQSSGLPSRISIIHRETGDVYLLRLVLNQARRNLVMNADEDPLRLYTRVLQAGRGLASRDTERASRESDSLQGYGDPWPAIIENFGPEVAVSGHAHWFTVHVTPPRDVLILPPLAASWSIFPIAEPQGEGVTAELGEMATADAGRVASMELSVRLNARLEGAIHDYGVVGLYLMAQNPALVLPEALGVLGDVTSYGLSAVNEFGGERGIIFPEPGRYIVRAIVFPRLTHEDAAHFNIDLNNVPMPSVAVFPITVETPEIRAGHITEQGDIPSLLAEIEQLQTRIDAETAQGESSAELSAQLAQAQARLRSLQQQASLSGYLSQQSESTQDQIDTLAPLIAFIDRYGPGEHIVRDDVPADHRNLWDRMHAEWTRQQTFGRQVDPDFRVWLRVYQHKLQQAAAATRLQQEALNEHQMRSAHRMPGAFIAHNGQQIPLVLAVEESVDSETNITTVTLIDLSEVSAPNSKSQARVFHGRADRHSTEARRAAFEAVVDNYVENCAYGHGFVLLRRPLLWDDNLGLPDQWYRPRHPGASERWQERFENIARAAGLVGMVIGGPVGIMLGVAGGLSSAAAAAIRLRRRWVQETLQPDADAFFAVIDILSAPIAVYTAGARAIGALQGAGRVVIAPSQLERLVNLGEMAERVQGAVQVGAQLLLLPNQLDSDLAGLQDLPGHERRVRVIQLWLGYAEQFPGLVLSMRDLVGPQHPIDLGGNLPTHQGTRSGDETPGMRGSSPADSSNSHDLPDSNEGTTSFTSVDSPHEASSTSTEDTEIAPDTRFLTPEILRQLLAEYEPPRRHQQAPDAHPDTTPPTTHAESDTLPARGTPDPEASEGPDVAPPRAPADRGSELSADTSLLRDPDEVAHNDAHELFLSPSGIIRCSSFCQLLREVYRRAFEAARSRSDHYREDFAEYDTQLQRLEAEASTATDPDQRRDIVRLAARLEQNLRELSVDIGIDVDRPQEGETRLDVLRRRASLRVFPRVAEGATDSAIATLESLFIQAERAYGPSDAERMLLGYQPSAGYDSATIFRFEAALRTRLLNDLRGYHGRFQELFNDPNIQYHGAGVGDRQERLTEHLLEAQRAIEAEEGGTATLESTVQAHRFARTRLQLGQHITSQESQILSADGVRRRFRISGRLAQSLSRDIPGGIVGLERYLLRGSEIGLGYEYYELAHLWGPGFGDESFYIMLAPQDFNQIYQNKGIEETLRSWYRQAQYMAGVEIHLTVEAEGSFGATANGDQYGLLDSITYNIIVIQNGEPVMVNGQDGRAVPGEFQQRFTINRSVDTDTDTDTGTVTATIDALDAPLPETLLIRRSR